MNPIHPIFDGPLAWWILTALAIRNYRLKDADPASLGQLNAGSDYNHHSHAAGEEA